MIWKLQLQLCNKIRDTIPGADNPTLYEVSTWQPKNVNVLVYDIDISKLKSQAGPKSGWQLPFKHFNRSLSTAQEADYTNYILLIVEIF